MNWDTSARRQMSEAEDYHRFTALYFELSQKTYAGFSRVAGFSSRSFPRDIVTRKRRLSPKSLAKFTKGLLIPSSGKEYFELLVAQKETDVLLSLKIKPSQLTLKLSNARRRFVEDTVRSRSSRDYVNQPASQLDRLLSAPWVAPLFAAMGTTENGATVAEMTRRLGVPAEKLTFSLRRLEEVGFCQRVNDRYVPASLHANIQGAGKSAFFKKLFEEATLRSLRRAAVALESDEEFFFVSAFLVKEERLSELKAKMRKLFLEFVDENIDPDGKVVEIATSLHKLAGTLN